MSRVVCQGMLLVFLGFGVLSVATMLQMDRSATAGGVVLLLGVGFWAAVCVPLIRGWSRTGDLARQARLLEGQEPSLRGRLVTSVQYLKGPENNESVALLDLIARRALNGAEGVEPRRVHGSRPLVLMTLCTLGVAMIGTTLTCLAPGGPLGVLRWGLGADSALAAHQTAQAVDETERGRVGDINIRYVYPAYTGLEALEVPNSTGEVHGPPGTVVHLTLKSAETIEAAALYVYEEPPLDAAVEQGRTISGAFTIQVDPGSYRVAMFADGVEKMSVDFEISPEPDLAPEVMLDRAETTYEIGVDEPLGLSWEVRDDFGISKVDLELNDEVARSLLEVRDRDANVSGVLNLRPLDLGLRPGSKVRLVVAAWDNDEWSGRKVGRSQVVHLVVLGAQGAEMVGNERRIEIRDLLVDVLAGHLIDPWPPGRVGADLARWGEEVAKRYTPLQDLIQEHPTVMRGPSTGRILSAVIDSATELIRFTQVSFDPYNTEMASKGSITTTSTLRDLAVAELEHGIIVLDRLIQQVALKDLVEQADKLDSHGGRLTTLSQGDVEPFAVMSQLDQMKRILDAIKTPLNFMEDGGIRLYVEQREVELRAITEEIQAELANENNAAVQELMGRAARQVRELKEGLDYRLKQEENSENQLGEDLKKLKEELESLERTERELQLRTRALREAGDSDGAKKAEARWERIEELVTEAQTLGERFLDGLESNSRMFYEVERARGAVAETVRLRRAAQARDLEKATQDAVDAQEAWSLSQQTAMLERGSGRATKGPGVSDAQSITRRLDEVRQLLQAQKNEAEAVGPQTARETRALEGEQRALEERTAKARQMAEQVAQQMPIQPRGLDESMEEALSEMRRAGESLGRGMPMPAEGAEGQAADRLQEAQEALKQAMQEMARQARARRGSDNEGDGKRKQAGDEEDDLSDPNIEIPSPEDFRSPEEYRRSLLEGMQGEVPEEYKGMKKRYFEELVRQ